MDEIRSLIKPSKPSLQRDHPLARGLIAAWPFYEGNGEKLNDVSGFRNGGTLTSGPTWTPGKFGNTLNFNGTSYVQLTNPTVPIAKATPFTLSWWENVSSGATTYLFVASFLPTDATQSTIFMRSTDPSYGPFANGVSNGASNVVYAGAPSIAASIGAWNHFALVGRAGMDSVTTTDFTLYVNGVAYAGSAGAGLLSSTSNQIASRNNSFTYVGQLDDMRLYNRVLTPAEIRNLYEDPFAIYRPKRFPARGANSIRPSRTGLAWRRKSPDMLHKPNPPILDRSHPLARGLVGAWPFYETSGDFINDFSGNNNKATWNATSILTRWKTGPRGSVGRFDGTNDFANITSPNVLDLQNELTIACWVNPNTISATFGIIGNGNSGGTAVQWALAINASGRIAYLHNSGTAFQPSANTALVVGTWFHVAAVRTGTAGAWAVSFYLNGVLDGSGTSANNPSTTQTAAIGAIGALTSNRCNGSLEGITVHNRALNAGEIQQLYSDPWGIYRPYRYYATDRPTPSASTGGGALYLPLSFRSSDYKKPLTPTINRTHPLANKLAAAYSMHEGAGETVMDLSRNNKKALMAANPPLWSTGTRGKGLLASTSTTILSLATAPFFKWWSADWSIFVYMNILDTNTQATKIYFSYGGGSTNGDWYFRQSATATNLLSFNYIDIDFADDEFQFAGAWPGPGMHSILLTAKNEGGVSITPKLYVDGVNKPGAAGTINPGSDSTNDSSGYNMIGRGANVSNHIQLVHYVWAGRTLQAGEARDLHQDPFALIRPRRYVSTGGGSGGAVAAPFTEEFGYIF